MVVGSYNKTEFNDSSSMPVCGLRMKRFANMEAVWLRMETTLKLLCMRDR